MIKNQVTVDCKIKYLKNLITKKNTDEEIFLGNSKIKDNVLNILESNKWIIKKNGKYELNTNISLDDYSTQKGIIHNNFKFPEEDWVKSQTAKYLKKEGYQIIYVAWGHDKGTDVIGYNPITKRFINIEAKGGSDGDDSITPEGTNFYDCLGQCVASISTTKEDYAMSFPLRTSKDKDYNKHYNIYGERWNIVNRKIKEKLKIKAIFIDKDGEIFISDENNDIPIDKYSRMY